MSVGLFELMGLALALGTAGLLAIVSSGPPRDDFAQMNRRLTHSDARRAARHTFRVDPSRSSGAGAGADRSPRRDRVPVAGDR